MLPNLPNSSKFPHQSGLPAPCVKLQHLIRAFVRFKIFKTVSWEFLSTDLLLNMSTIALAGRVMSERFSRATLYNAVVVYQTLTQFSFESISKRQISEISETEAKLFPKPPLQPLKAPPKPASDWQTICYDDQGFGLSPQECQVQMASQALSAKLSSKQSVPCHKQCEWTEWFSSAIRVHLRAFNPKALSFNNTMRKSKNSIVYTT